MNMNTKVDHPHRRMSGRYPTEVPNEVIESQTKKIPNLVFLGLAGASIIGSAIFTFQRKQTNLGNFIGLWAPTIMLLGLYNKMVKVEDELIRNQKYLQ